MSPPSISPYAYSMDSSFPFPDQVCVSRSLAVLRIWHWPCEVRLWNSPCTVDRLSVPEVLLHLADIAQCQTYDRRSLSTWWPSRRPDTEAWTSPIDSTPYCLPLTLYTVTSALIHLNYYNTIHYNYSVYRTIHIEIWTSPIGSTLLHLLLTLYMYQH